MALDAQRPLLDFAELDAVANHGVVIEGNGLAQTGDIVRHLFSQSCDVRGQFVDAINVPIKTRVDLLEAQIHLIEAPVDLFEAPVDLFEAPVDLFEPPVMCGHPLGDLANLSADLANLLGQLAYLPGDFGQ
jgi:hypothetical protein